MSARLLWLTERYPPARGGMAVSCDRIVHALRKREVFIDLVHLRRGALRAASLARENGRDLVVPVGEDAPHALAALWSRLERENAGWTHVVAFGGALPLAAAPAYAAWLGVPLAVLLRGNDFDTGALWPERRATLEDAIRRAARVGCVTEGLRRRVQRLFPGAAAVWTPNGIDLEEWSALSTDRNRAEAFRGAQVEPGRFLIGLFGDLKPKKGVETLLGAISEWKRGEKIHLLIAGAVPQDFLARLPSGSRATFLPAMPRTELIPYFLACDAAALPSLYEGFPNVLLEAAALGVPLLASDAGAADVLEDGVHGALFRAGDAADCGRALGRLLEADEALRARWREACAALARRFSLERERERFLEIFRETGAARTATVTRLPGAGSAE